MAGNEKSGRKEKETGQKVRISGRLEPDVYEKFELIGKERGWKPSQVIEYFINFVIENQKDFDKWFSERLK